MLSSPESFARASRPPSFAPAFFEQSSFVVAASANVVNAMTKAVSNGTDLLAPILDETVVRTKYDVRIEGSEGGKCRGV